MVRRTLMATRMTRVMATMARTAMRTTSMMTTTMLATTEVAITMDNLVLLAAAGIDAPALSHAVGRGDQGAQEAAADPTRTWRRRCTNAPSTRKRRTAPAAWRQSDIACRFHGAAW